jgi:hypothetical protein
MPRFYSGGANVLFAALGLFYFQPSTSLTLGTGMLGLILTSLVLFFYGLVIIGTISAGWRKEPGKGKAASDSRLEPQSSRLTRNR